MGQDSPAAERRTVLVVDYPLFARDFAAWLEQRGYRVEWLVPQALSVELFGKVCSVLRPPFIASINFSPELAVLCSRAKTPYLSWTVDPLGPERFTLYPGTEPAFVLAFAHRRQIAERLRALGFADAEYLPLAASGRRQPLADDLERYRTPISFVGSSLAQEERALGQGLERHGAAPEVVSAFDHFVSQALDAHDGDVSYAGVGPDGSGLPEELRARLPPGIGIAELSDWVNGALSSRLRRRQVGALAELGITLYGDAGWQQSGGRYAGIADHGDELTRVYCASALNLDVPRIYQRDIVTMRVFDIMACGGVVLSEPSADLLQLFSDGTELVCYRDQRELRERAGQLLAAEPERAAIARAGREAVLREHLLEHRFERMAAGLARRGFI